MNKCQNCAKIFCKNRTNNKEYCEEQITFLQAGIIEPPVRLPENKEEERNKENGRRRFLLGRN